MTNRLTLGKVRTACARMLNLNPSDSKVAEYISEAQERLLHKGKWVGTYGRYVVCVNNSCITWPREIETIESIAICDWPGTVRNGWFEFLGTGLGVRSEDSGCGMELIDRGDAVAFDDVTGSDKKLAIYADVSESTTARIILRFYDSGGNWVRTQLDGAWIDGQSMLLPVAGTYSYTTNNVAPGGLVQVIKPRTNGIIRLYEYNTVTGLLKPLAYYEPDEELPVYRRSLIPGLSGHSSSADCDTVKVEVVAKMRHIPVVNDNDFLLISSVSALKLGCKALRQEENNVWDEAMLNWRNAEMILNEQLKHWQGDGAVQPLQIESAMTFGGGIPNLR